MVTESLSEEISEPRTKDADGNKCMLSKIEEPYITHILVETCISSVGEKTKNPTNSYIEKNKKVSSHRDKK